MIYFSTNLLHRLHNHLQYINVIVPTPLTFSEKVQLPGVQPTLMMTVMEGVSGNTVVNHLTLTRLPFVYRMISPIL